MSSLKSHEKVVFEKLFDDCSGRGPGYVLDFTDRTYSEFFRESGLNIDHPKYQANGGSKMKRLRAFWEIEPDAIVGKVLEELLKYAEAIKTVGPKDKIKAKELIDRLLGRKTTATPVLTEDEFLNLQFSRLNLSLLNLDGSLHDVITQRIDEIKKSLKSQASLAVIFLCGSTLEGLLLEVGSKNIQKFNIANSAPKKEGKVKPLHEWSLESLINVAYETGFIELDIKKFSHELRDFRNYIHPRQQVAQKFNPDPHTAEMSWKVLQATIASLSGQRRK